ncbi:MAG: peptidylprolyl isomerase [Sterolibacterium sp.]|jgi:cyclophilin family peptidyl-prolyl cis-trans isomerase
MNTVNIAGRLVGRSLAVGLAAILSLAVATASQATTVRLQTTLGIIDIQLFDAAAPLTVANFLSYVNSGAYDDTFIHRSIPGFIIQGGGYTLGSTANSTNPVPAQPPVANEFSASRSNLRGTIAMAKVPDDPNSATSQWFINLANNSTILDGQNGGFTVFGRVLGSGMAIVDAIAALPTVDASGAFSYLPLATPRTTTNYQRSNFVMLDQVSSDTANAGTADADRVFAFLEAAFPQYLLPANPLSPVGTISQSALGYYYRYYPSSNAYIATANGTLYYLGPLSGNQPISLGTLADGVATVSQAGY